MIFKIASGTSIYDTTHKMLNDLGFVDDGAYSPNTSETGVYLKYGNLLFLLWVSASNGVVAPNSSTTLYIFSNSNKSTSKRSDITFFNTITSGSYYSDPSYSTFSCSVSTYYYKTDSCFVAGRTEDKAGSDTQLEIIKTKNSTVFLGYIYSFGDNLEVDNDGTYTVGQRYIPMHIPSSLSSSCCFVIPLVLCPIYQKDTLDIIDNLYICNSEVPGGAVISVNGKLLQRIQNASHTGAALCFPYVTSES